jgi:hypothetical protein
MNLVDTNVVFQVRHPKGTFASSGPFPPWETTSGSAPSCSASSASAIALMRNQSRHAELTAWYARLLANFGHVALPVTAAVSELWDGPRRGGAPRGTRLGCAGRPDRRDRARA